MDNIKGILFVLVQVHVTAAVEYCYVGGSYYTYCDDGQYCCNENTSCCSDFSAATIIGIVFGCIALVLCCAAAVIILVKKKKRPGVVINTAQPGGPVTVATIQNQYPSHSHDQYYGQPHGQPHGQPYGQPQGPPYGSPGMLPAAPPYSQPSNLPPPYSKDPNPAYPTPIY